MAANNPTSTSSSAQSIAIGVLDSLGGTSHSLDLVIPAGRDEPRAVGAELRVQHPDLMRFLLRRTKPLRGG